MKNNDSIYFVKTLMIYYKLLLGVVLKYMAGSLPYASAELFLPLNDFISLRRKSLGTRRKNKLSDCVFRVVKCLTVTIIVDTYSHIELNFSFRERRMFS